MPLRIFRETDDEPFPVLSIDEDEEGDLDDDDLDEDELEDDSVDDDSVNDDAEEDDE